MLAGIVSRCSDGPKAKHALAFDMYQSSGLARDFASFTTCCWCYLHANSVVGCVNHHNRERRAYVTVEKLHN